MTTTTTVTDPTHEFVRLIDLPRRFPVFGRYSWQKHVGSGVLPSVMIGRKRVVRVSDVIAFLAGTQADDGLQKPKDLAGPNAELLAACEEALKQLDIVEHAMGGGAMVYRDGKQAVGRARNALETAVAKARAR